MVKLCEYSQVIEDGEVVDLEEKIVQMRKQDFAGATIDRYNTQGMIEFLVTLKDGRKIHILPNIDGENFDFALFKEEQPAGVA